ncbi:hypothetical protein RM553_09235 [Zunongwangia sp. F363]|uniref:Uncharacterized protein n=1 Tax=Autumnicola tepida TaxID=3075595 RepID=A0ABU3C9I7_9FLAO|nr:hypothetical protein [Zunongwangia sp. F363]MDT0643008.1 hypothetical protein [Zunongwangia sp. F363]
MPVVLGICLKTVQWLKQDKQLNLKILPILSLTVFYSLYFELLLPEIMSRYTADFLDVIMYFSGAVLFFLMQHVNLSNKKAAQKSSS